MNQFAGVGKDITPPFEEQPTVMEIMPGMTVEEMECLFKDALIEPKYKVWQLNSKGHRYYYRYDDAGNPEFFPSVTTILSQTLPQSPWLVKWIADNGIDEAERYKNERAMYGTFMHAQFEELIIARVYDLDGLKEKLKAYIDKNNLPTDFIYYADDLKKDVLAFAQFVIDYDVRPLAVEIALVHPQCHYAGMIDLPCTMVDPKTRERFVAIVDFKSGRKGFHEEHEIQLGMYRELWNVNFPDKEVTRIFNFSPKDWLNTPTYNLKEQTQSPNLAKIPYLLELAMIEDNKIDNVFKFVSGTIYLPLDGVQPNLSDNVMSLSLAGIVKTRTKKQKPAPDMQVIAEEPAPSEPEPEKKVFKKKKIIRTIDQPIEQGKKTKLLESDIEI